jgi:hypothetical protein
VGRFGAAGLLRLDRAATFVGAFFIQRFGVRESAVGWLLAAAAAVVMAGSALLVLGVRDPQEHRG